ncbi:MAG: CPBP family intramembrane metalloprotease [Myxococcales bacterium]|nr:CPBP family intramembrane metalloprotease [Myxococcales bacterium]
MNHPRATWRLASLHLALFLSGSALWMASLVSTVALSGVAGDSADVASLGPGLLGAITALQMAGLGTWAVLLARLASGAGPWALRTSEGTPHLWRDVLALRPAPWIWWSSAVVGGLTLWMLPSWFASWLIDTTGTDDSAVQHVTELLSQQPLGASWPLVGAIVVVAPLCEEIIFRGYLWRVVEHATGSVGAWLVTTLLFALYHLDPIQSVALLPTALFLGWLRLATGSIAPAMLAHCANNLVGVVVARSLDPGATADLTAGAPLAVLGGVITLAAATAPLLWTRRS